MKIPRKIVETVEAKSVRVHVKVSDSGCYELKDANGELIAEIDEDYVPSFFPEDHYGDYLILDIELETGRILNWKCPEPVAVARAFKILPSEDGGEG
jgi:hypothetical protein